MLRAFFIVALVAIGIRFSFRGPFYILLFYLWNAYFRPEDWLWNDFLSQFRPSLLIGLALLATVTLSRRSEAAGSRGLLLFGLFLAQATLATAASPATADLWPFWIEFAKTLVISMVIIVLVNTEERLRWTMLVIALSLGFEGAKQGWVQLVVNPGARNTNEWPMLGDNNGVAIGMLMLVPLLIVLAETSTTKARKVVGRFLAVGVLLRALATYSRGGFLAACGLGLHYLMRSKRKVVGLIAVAILAATVSQVMPQAFWDRMSTIQGAAETTEARRVYFWELGIQMAADYPLTGVGLNAYPAMYNTYDTTRGEFGTNRDVHSSWVALTADLGFVGLALFLLLILTSLLTVRRTRRLATGHASLTNLARYGSAFEAQILVFALGGTFMSFQYKEILWHSLALAFALRGIVNRRLTALNPAGEASPPSIEPEILPARRSAGGQRVTSART